MIFPTLFLSLLLILFSWFFIIKPYFRLVFLLFDIVSGMLGWDFYLTFTCCAAGGSLLSVVLSFSFNLTYLLVGYWYKQEGTYVFITSVYLGLVFALLHLTTSLDPSNCWPKIKNIFSRRENRWVLFSQALWWTSKLQENPLLQKQFPPLKNFEEEMKFIKF